MWFKLVHLHIVHIRSSSCCCYYHWCLSCSSSDHISWQCVDRNMCSKTASGLAFQCLSTLNPSWVYLIKYTDCIQFRFRNNYCSSVGCQPNKRTRAPFNQKWNIAALWVPAIRLAKPTTILWISTERKPNRYSINTRIASINTTLIQIRRYTWCFTTVTSIHIELFFVKEGITSSITNWNNLTQWATFPLATNTWTILCTCIAKRTRIVITTSRAYQYCIDPKNRIHLLYLLASW